MGDRELKGGDKPVVGTWSWSLDEGDWGTFGAHVMERYGIETAGFETEADALRAAHEFIGSDASLSKGEGDWIYVAQVVGADLKKVIEGAVDTALGDIQKNISREFGGAADALAERVGDLLDPGFSRMKARDAIVDILCMALDFRSLEPVTTFGHRESWLASCIAENIDDLEAVLAGEPTKTGLRYRG